MKNAFMELVKYWKEKIMAILENKKRKTWKVRCYYKDIQGSLRQKTKRGFRNKTEARNWKCDFLLIVR